MLDTGDALVGGGILGDATRGEAVVAGMNLMGYQAMALGPMELTLGVETLEQRVAQAEFPIVSANVYLQSSGELLAAPYAVLEVDGYQIGVLGLTAAVGRAPDAPAVPAELVVRDPRSAAAAYVGKMRAEVDLVVVLTNLTYRQGLELASAVPGIDLMVTGSPGQLPNSAVAAPDTGTLVVTAEQPFPKHTGRRVGLLQTRLGHDAKLGADSWASVSMDSSFVDDPFMAGLLAGYEP